MNNKLLQEEETGDKASRLAMPLLQLDNGPKIAEPGQPHSYHVPLWARCATWHLKCLPGTHIGARTGGMRSERVQGISSVATAHLMPSQAKRQWHQPCSHAALLHAGLHHNGGRAGSAISHLQPC